VEEVGRLAWAMRSFFVVILVGGDYVDHFFLLAYGNPTLLSFRSGYDGAIAVFERKEGRPFAINGRRISTIERFVRPIFEFDFYLDVNHFPLSG
jgi:hypothetical protein